jgi:RimJ/RimL family protein N-acetyltransferase
MSAAAAISATPELIDAERRDPAELAAALGARLPADWPPEHHDPNALRYSREALEQPDQAGWWLHYFVAGDELVGVGGFKGPPADGMVEVGYSVVPSRQRRGYATAAVAAMIEMARERGASTVRAETLPSLPASIGVLEKLGFTPAPSSEAGVMAFELELAQPSA